MSHEAEKSALTDEAASIVAEFQFFSDWEERYQYLIAMGRQLPPLDAGVCVEANRLYGCQSVVYFKADFCDGVMRYQATSDAAIVQGLIALILRVYSGQKPEAIIAHPPDFLKEIGLDEHLSPTRKSGLAAMMGAIMEAARAHSGAS